MSTNTTDSAEGFNPYSFAEQWLKTEWHKHQPEELRRYLYWAKRKGEDSVEREVPEADHAQGEPDP